MATSTSAPSSGEISLEDIFEVLYGSSASGEYNLEEMHNLSGFAGEYDLENWYEYKVECLVTSGSSLSFDATGSPSQNIDVSIGGGDATFTSTPEYSWINVTDFNDFDIVRVACDPNSGGFRTGIVTITHDNNPDIYDTVLVRQLAVLSTTTTTTTTTVPKIIVKIETL